MFRIQLQALFSTSEPPRLFVPHNPNSGVIVAHYSPHFRYVSPCILFIESKENETVMQIFIPH